MDTAMIATDRVASSSSTSADRNDTRSTRMVAVRYRSPASRSWSACAAARPKIRRVGSPATRSRKNPDSWDSRPHWRCTATVVYCPMRIMNTGISGSVTARITAASTSCVRIVSPTASGTTTASTSCGRYRAK